MRRVLNLIIPALTVAVLLMVSMAASSSSHSPDKVRESLLAVQVAGDVVENYANEHFVLPAATQGLVPVSSLRDVLDPSGSRFFAKKDAWGHDLLFWADSFNYMIVSLGSDGHPDYDYEQAPPYAGISPGVNDEATQDIVLVNGAILRGPFGQRRDPRRTMADIRSIGTACEEYAIDNNFYPNSNSTVVSVEFLASHLEPIYIRSLPRQDSWQKPLLYWSNSTST